MGEYENELYKRQMEIERLRVQEETQKRMKELEEFRKAEEQRKAAEEAAKKSNMVADPEPAVANWPDEGFQAAEPGRLDGVKGALGIGAAGDAKLARDLLNSGQAPLGGVAKPEQTADGAKESAAGSRAVKPALGLG